jgi:hypothetical protein
VLQRCGREWGPVRAMPRGGEVGEGPDVVSGGGGYGGGGVWQATPAQSRRRRATHGWRETGDRGGYQVGPRQSPGRPGSNVLEPIENLNGFK